MFPSHNPAPVVNKVLAELFAAEPNPMEKLARDQASAQGIWAMGSVHANFLKHGRFVQLDCGHFTVTKGLHRARCPRCGEMIRAGYDYDAFRNLGADDEFSWPGDPLRALHERRRGPVHERLTSSPS